jgi:hypothetical protein
MTRSCLLGTMFLKIASFGAFQSLQMVRILIDLAPFWIVLYAFVIAVWSQVLNSLLGPGMHVWRFSLLQMSNQICRENEHFTRRYVMDSESWSYIAHVSLSVKPWRRRRSLVQHPHVCHCQSSRGVGAAHWSSIPRGEPSKDFAFQRCP